MATSDGYGVLDTGFLKKRLPEIQAEIQTALVAAFGGEVETGPTSVVGVLIDTFAERESAVWEEMEALYNSRYPGTAVGAALDLAVAYSGVTRLAAANTAVDVTVTGTNGTVLPAGSQVQAQGGGTLFATSAAATISANAAVSAKVGVGVVANSTSYSISLNGVAYTFTSDDSATAGKILTGLAAAVVPSGLTIVNDGAQLTISALNGATFGMVVSTNLTLGAVSSIARFYAATTGAITALAGTLTQIVTAVSGWASASNAFDGTVGRDDETDDELRLRYQSGVYRLGAATPTAIQANVAQNVVGVTACVVAENASDVVDSGGRPPHSVQVVVSGGSLIDIASEIFRVKAAGIDTFGELSQQVTDSQGGSHTINFSRPAPVYIWVKAAVTPFSDGQETYPSTGPVLVQGAINTFGNSLGIGKDVILQRFYAPINSATPGIDSVDLTFYATTDPAYTPVPSDYSATNVAITSTQESFFDPSRIQVS